LDFAFNSILGQAENLEKLYLEIDKETKQIKDNFERYKVDPTLL